MKIKQYKSFRDILEAIIERDKEYILIKHFLGPKDKIRLHYHKKANEWVIIANGKFRVELEDKERTFNLKNQVMAIYFPKKKKHTILALAPISYLVIRDYKDNSIYCKD